MGVVTTVGADGFTAEQEAHLIELVGLAGARIAEVGSPRAETAMHLLAQATNELALLSDIHQVENAAA
ncbi:MAG TPA: hypothetical protein DCS55_18165, partial [Acidimicrobiaceae bacterium]|nr:hypothetical protein [Acidimicrobiaceae bacterium]